MQASVVTAGGLNGSQAELSRDLWDLPLCHWGSTCVPCTGRRIPNHWTTGEVHMVSFLKSSVSYLLLAALHLLVWPLTKLGFSASAPWKEHWVGSSSLRFRFQTLQTQRQATTSLGLGFFTHCARNTAPLRSSSPWQTALID